MIERDETASITLAGGCFWCTEAAFLLVDGVLDVTSGYAQGSIDHPTYAQVCTGTTGHAEVVRIRFAPQRVTLQQLLDVFFIIHDPTTRDRQGADVGSQYRSGIYFERHEDGEIARHYVRTLANSGRWGGAAIVTEIEPLRAFWPAEAEHHRYFERHPGQGYCQVVIAPKLSKLQQLSTLAMR